MIFSKGQSFKIERWLSEDGVSVYFQLLYQGFLDVWEGGNFHHKCDNKGETIVVICSTGGFIYGGFSNK